MSSFYGLNIAKSGLFFSQKALNVTGHNISNVHTPGYTRQRLVGESIDPASGKARIMPLGKGRVGGGTETFELAQVRNAFVDKQLRLEYADYGMLQSKEDTLIYIEKMFDEIGQSNLSATMKDFFNSLHELSVYPDKIEMRTNVKQSAIKMTETFNHVYRQLSDLQKVQNDSIKVTVDNINDIFEDIAWYNENIFMFELSGEKALDLRDKRNLLLDELALLVDIDYAEDLDGKLSISIGGKEVLYHKDVKPLQCIADTTGVVSGLEDFYTVYYNDATTPLNIRSGELQAYIDMRDGNASNSMGIPYMMEELNVLVRSIAKAFNDQNAQGWTYPHGTEVSQQGGDFFKVFDTMLEEQPPGSGNWVTVPDYSSITAGNFVLDQSIYDDPYKIATSSVEIILTGDNPQQGNDRNILAMVELCSATDIDGVSSFEGYLKNYIVAIGVESGHVQKLNSAKMAVVSNLESRRTSISGVSLDEEVTMMMQYQHAYAACSRVINAVDEALDVLINRTGLVGRA
ncbi:flagellar hook-associated protein FlgK [Eubacteriales bacterium OttesenSCG-928-M02]|nr:flagellar hook-associated protein FlgK [Eubacteriales bacterium OttesenSCG-928-M02]